MSTQAVRIRPGLKDTAELAGAALVWLLLYRLNEPFWDWLIYTALGLSPESAAGSALHFFGYDVVKITLLLVGIIFIVTVLRSFMSLERTRALLGGKREGVGNVMAAGLGVTPLTEPIRLRRRGDWTFAFNYGDTPWTVPASARMILGERTVAPSDVAIYRVE